MQLSLLESIQVQNDAIPLKENPRKCKHYSQKDQFHCYLIAEAKESNRTIQYFMVIYSNVNTQL